MLDYSEVTLHKYIIFENEPWEVIGSHVFRKQQRKPSLPAGLPKSPSTSRTKSRKRTSTSRK
ncbi:hypothetical protein KW784_01800 [Candidatus Parcubacteria bacterium]|nr:hypothetical protein [Candidatus Parcubacteria bacterium]